VDLAPGETGAQDEESDMPATTATETTSSRAVRATEVAAALALQYGLASLLARAVSAASRRESAELAGHRIPAPRSPVHTE
jgi:hypothetical protein